MQSSKLDEARAMRDAYKTEYEREAFVAGYDHAHGIACHNVPDRGETYFTDSGGRVTVDTVEDARDAHAALCFEAERWARCYTPWELITERGVNSLDEEHGEGASEAARSAYDDGVVAATAHDLEGYTAEGYGFDA